MCKLVAAREAVLMARKAVLDAVREHDWLFGLDDADSLLQDAAAQISGEIAKRKAGTPSDPVALQAP
jgi:hypothetical protein